MVFLDKVADSDSQIFHSKKSRFNISVFESIFVSTCKNAFSKKNLDVSDIDLRKVKLLKEDDEFIKATQSHTSNEKNVKFRMERANRILK